MIKSMTGFGRRELQKGTKRYGVELRSVNHRYLDVNIRMPKKLNFFDTAIRALLKQHASRGKIDIFITYEDTSENQISLKFNAPLAAKYMEYFQFMEKDLGLRNDVSVSTLSRFPEVFTMEEQGEDEEELWLGLEEAIKGALTQLVEAREREGGNLKRDIVQKLSAMEKQVAIIEVSSPKIVAEYRERLEAKVKELLADTQMEESRIAAEVILFADKICTDEELVRLKSHIGHMRSTLEEQEGIGRKLDFIAQEMNREANTILSKANDLEVSNCAISLKAEIEKVREQIQNIE